MYPAELVALIEAELTDVGFIPFKDAKQVTDHFTNHTGTTLLVVNSMCGCAGPDARMGVVEALATNPYTPDHLVTIFPNVDEEAMEEVQNYIKPYPLSSPSIALVKDGEVVYFMERHQIKGRPSEEIAEEIADALIEHC
jgi:putative YphP/YqiW family bacilliredoxin